MPKKIIPIAITIMAIAAALPAQNKTALVIGNGAYKKTAPLENPVNDAQDVAATLENLGFEVNMTLDASKGQINKAIDSFRQKASRTGTTVALFYYSGHGVEHEGINYIIPVTADISDEYQLVDQAVSLDRVTRAMDQGRAEFNMVVLDACRDNPFFKARSGGGRGLAAMSGGGKGSMIVFSTSPGNVAADGAGRNSPFTQAFIEHAATPGLELSTMMREINGTVRELTRGNQIPWFNAAYTGEVYLSNAEDMFDAAARTAEVNKEITALESEIARRQQAIEAARNEEEKKKLEAEQRLARAEEAARRMQAEQLASIQEQARQVLEQKKGEEALRNQMEQQLAAQREELSQQAQKRRDELAKLKKSGEDEKGVWKQLESIARLNSAIADINTRFDGMTTRMENEVTSLYTQQIDSLKENNPKTPIDTQEEYDKLIAGLSQELLKERNQELIKRKREINTTRNKELADLKKDLAEQKKSLEGSRYTLDASETRVAVSQFQAEGKKFPITIEPADAAFQFVMPAVYRLKSKERKAMLDEYYRVYSAAQSGGLAGEIRYMVTEVFPNVWFLKPTNATVVNLLKNDMVLTRSTEGSGMIISTKTKTQTHAAAIRLESGTVWANVHIGGKKVGRTPYVHLVEKPGALRVEYRWNNGKNRTMTVALTQGLNASVRAWPEKTERVALLWNAEIRNMRPDSGTNFFGKNPTLRWNRVSGATRYQLQMARSYAALSEAEVITATATTYPVQFDADGRWYWRVRALQSDGSVGKWSKTISLNYSLAPPGFVHVEGGTFTIGSPSGESGRDDDEGPQHQVSVSSFYISQYEVTQAQWQAVMGSNPSYFKGDNRPGENVSWYDAVKYCNALSKKEGLTPAYRINGSNVTWNKNANGYRLPTEAEWEYAARGGNKSRGYRYSGSNKVDIVAWYDDNSGDKTHNVGTKEANELGLYDMSGNVWEWCWDWYGDYPAGRQMDPTGPGSGSYRVNRGGSWYFYAGLLRSTNRVFNSPGLSSYDLGFRLVL